MTETIQILIGTLVLTQLIKIIFNWMVWNKNDPKHKVKFKVKHPGNIVASQKKVQEIHNSDWLLLMCGLFIHFWVNIPKDKTGKRLAWSVLFLTIIQIITITILILKSS